MSLPTRPVGHANLKIATLGGADEVRSKSFCRQNQTILMGGLLGPNKLFYVDCNFCLLQKSLQHKRHSCTSLFQLSYF